MAADAGMSPVALESGKLRVATFRRACDKRLRVAVATLADSTRHWHPWAKEVYRRARDPRPRPPACDPHPGPGLDQGALALLAGRSPL